MLAPAACAFSVAMPLIDVVRELQPFSWAYPCVGFQSFKVYPKILRGCYESAHEWMPSNNPPIGKPCDEAEDRSVDSCMASLVVSQTRL